MRRNRRNETKTRVYSFTPLLPLFHLLERIEVFAFFLNFDLIIILTSESSYADSIAPVGTALQSEWQAILTTPLPFQNFERYGTVYIRIPIDHDWNKGMKRRIYSKKIMRGMRSKEHGVKYSGQKSLTYLRHDIKMFILHVEPFFDRFTREFPFPMQKYE